MAKSHSSHLHAISLLTWQGTWNTGFSKDKAFKYYTALICRIERLMLNSNWGWLAHYFKMAYKVPTMYETSESMEKLSNDNNYFVKERLMGHYKTCKHITIYREGRKEPGSYSHTSINMGQERAPELFIFLERLLNLSKPSIHDLTTFFFL